MILYVLQELEKDVERIVVADEENFLLVLEIVVEIPVVMPSRLAISSTQYHDTPTSEHACRRPKNLNAFPAVPGKRMMHLAVRMLSHRHCRQP